MQQTKYVLTCDMCGGHGKTTDNLEFAKWVAERHLASTRGNHYCTITNATTGTKVL